MLGATDLWIASTQIAVAFGTTLLAGITALLVKRTRNLGTETAKVAQRSGDMATATVRLAEETSRAVREAAREATATEHQAEISAQALRESIRPWLTVRKDSNPALFDNGVNFQGSVQLTNTGQGIALIDGNDSWLLGYGAALTESPTQRYGHFGMTNGLVTPGETTGLSFFIERRLWDNVRFDDFLGRGGGGRLGTFGFDVRYTDATGTQDNRALIKIQERPDPQGRPSGWQVYEIEYPIDGRDPIKVQP